MAIFLCNACGTSYPDGADPPAECRICTDERQYVPAACETLYAAQGLPVLVRVRCFDAPLGTTLDALGYTVEGSSPVLWTPLGPGASSGHTVEGVELSGVRPGPGWLDAQARLSRPDVAARARILDAVAVPCAFAGARADGPGSPLALVAWGAMHGGVTCLHLVATDPAFQLRGLARRVVSALLAWVHDRAGARDATLQAAAENAGRLPSTRNSASGRSCSVTSPAASRQTGLPVRTGPLVEERHALIDT